MCPVMATSWGVYNYSNSDQNSGLIGPRSILPVTVSTMLNFNGPNFGVGTCEQAFIRNMWTQLEDSDAQVQ